MMPVFLFSLALVNPVVALPVGVHPAPLLEALAMKETGQKWDGQPGPRGELSRYQITEEVWKMHSSEPFSEARNESKARAVALSHLNWLAAVLIRHGINVTAERLATCWHYGASYFRRWTTWGQEVANLYEEATR
jgi:hypothetical protein